MFVISQVLRNSSKQISSEISPHPTHTQQGHSHLYTLPLQLSHVSPGQMTTFSSQMICVTGKILSGKCQLQFGETVYWGLQG